MYIIVNERKNCVQLTEGIKRYYPSVERIYSDSYQEEMVMACFCIGHPMIAHGFLIRHGNQSQCPFFNSMS